MTKRLVGIFWMMLSLLCGGASAATTVETISYRGWPQAYRLTNGTMEVVFVPCIGRIMRYAEVGGENLLWENPLLAGQISSPHPKQWSNFGGEKVWPWPQGDWDTIIGRNWPPPDGFDPLPFETEVLADHGLRVVSKVVSPFGLQVTREIHLADQGTRLTTLTRFQQIKPAESDKSVAVWSITQWPKPKTLLARLCGQGEKQITPLSGKFTSITPQPPDMIVLEPSLRNASKIGLEADELSVVTGDRMIVQHVVSSGSNDHWLPGERAQIYCDSDARAGVPSYVELEFTSPRQTLQVGQEMALKIDWEIQALPSLHAMK
jgi:hypothetical protein